MKLPYKEFVQLCIIRMRLPLALETRDMKANMQALVAIADAIYGRLVKFREDADLPEYVWHIASNVPLRYNGYGLQRLPYNEMIGQAMQEIKYRAELFDNVGRDVFPPPMEIVL